MFAIMVLSGFLSTMNVAVDKYQDIRLSLNDLYMVLLMTGWMFFLSGIFYADSGTALFGAALIIINLFFIRTQFMISQQQYLLGMIPHHSMAVHMSKKLLEKENNIDSLLANIITSQEQEIKLMKNLL